MVVLYLPKEVWGVELCCVWKRVIGKQSQPKNLPKNMRLFHFSPNLRASVGCSEEIRGFPYVALGKDAYILLGHVF
jgi:hypothetical protein